MLKTKKRILVNSLILWLPKETEKQVEDFEDIFGIIKRLLIATEVSKRTIQDRIVIVIQTKYVRPIYV